MAHGKQYDFMTFFFQYLGCTKKRSFSAALQKEEFVNQAYVPDRPAHWHYHPTLKVLEYQALGLPIIATDNEPNREVVENELNGLLVQNSNESLAKAMLRFVTYEGFFERCSLQAAAMRRGTIWGEVAKIMKRTFTKN